MDVDKTKEIKPTENTVPKKPHPVLVETFAEDIAGVIGEDAGGMVKNIIHAEEEREAQKKNLSPESKENKLLTVISFLLLVASLVIALFLVFTKKPSTVPVQPQFIPLIFTDKSVSLDVSGKKASDIEQSVADEITNTAITPSNVEGIYLTENKQVIGLRRFITLIGSHFVPDPNPILLSDSFLLGVVQNQPDASLGTGFFILMKVRSATDVFDSLRAWEPNMLTDLHGFFGLNVSSATNYLFTKSFTDGIIENKNARILYDQYGNIVLMYVFADDNSIVITDSQNAADQVILRLASSQLQQ